MANVQTYCTSFKQDLFNGQHSFGFAPLRATTNPDSFFAALYLQSGSQGAGTIAYSSTNEVSGTNYSAGGVAVPSFTLPTTAGIVAYTTPSANIVYSNVTLTSPFDCVTIYNNTLAGRNAIAHFTFIAQTLVAGTLTINMPVNNAATALFQIA